VPQPTSVPQPTTPSSTSPAATAACSALLGDVPSAPVKSGKATLAAAWDVTGNQLAAYMEHIDEINGGGPNNSIWREKPNKQLTVCIFDGDFETMTPGPPGHDTSSPRVLIVIEDGLADLWAMARQDASLGLPLTDPATL
jgi:hypothetical protein